MIKSGITQGTPANILFGAGVYFHGVAYSEKVAPTEEAILKAIIGATQDGGNVTITPEFFEPELDGKLVKMKELQQKVGETAVMETSFVEMTADIVAKTVIGKISASTDGEYDVITSASLGVGHFYSGFGFYGNLLDGRPVIIMFKNALCTSGFATDPKNKTNSIFKGTFECQSDTEYGTDKLPYAIFIRKKDGWTATNVDEVAA